MSPGRSDASSAELEVGLVDWHAHMLSDRLTPPSNATGVWPGVRANPTGFELTLADKFYRRIDERTFDAAARLADMDETGVHTQVLSPPPYAVAFDGPPGEQASVAAQQNEFLAEVAGSTPGRFAVFGMLPYGDQAAVDAEMDRLAGYPEVVGVCLTAYRDDHLCAPEHEQLWHQLAAAGLLVFVHPADTHVPDCDRSAGSVFGAAMPSATARTATRLITSGILAAVPELQILLAHSGGALPATIDRLTQGWRMGDLPGLAASPLDQLRRSFWADNVVYAAAPLQLAAHAFGADRIVYGSDYPFLAAQSPRELEALDPVAGLLDQSRANGARLLSDTTARRAVALLTQVSRADR